MENPEVGEEKYVLIFDALGGRNVTITKISWYVF